MKKILFLFGSGISPKSIPKTSEITEEVLSGTLYRREIVGANKTEEYVKEITIFINWIKTEIDSYYKHLRHNSNYEEIYYIISQIEDHRTLDFENPIVQPFIEKITKSLDYSDRALEELSVGAKSYIENIVLRMLNIQILDIHNLNLLIESIKDETTERIPIYTLNHDLVLENLFMTNKIEYENGFKMRDDGIKYFNFNNYLSIENGVILVKLHGSVDWYRCRYGKSKSEDIGVFPEVDPNAVLSPRPVILMGTFNKMIDYSYYNIFLQLQYLFYNVLKTIDTLIVSGYSFGDKGINARIVEWMSYKTENKIIVIALCVKDVMINSRAAIGLKWENWENEGRLVGICKGIEKTEWAEVKELL